MTANAITQRHRMWRDLDFVLLAAVLVLIGLGIAMIQSATANTPGLENVAERQFLYSVGGLAIVIILSLIDYRILCSLQKPIYVILVASLLAVSAIGFVAGGSQSWIDLGLFPIQPSELAKIFMILVLARYLANHEAQMRRLLYVIFALILLAPPVILVYLQPDLGTAVSLLVIGIVMILMGGMRLFHIIVLGILGTTTLPVLWMSLQGYMRDRVLLFLYPENNPTESYNINQALISIGSGGWLGKGYGLGSQSQLHFLRVRHTDFIFSVVAEELGFVGSVILILLLLVVLLRLLRIASRARIL